MIYYILFVICCSSLYNEYIRYKRSKQKKVNHIGLAKETYDAYLIKAEEMKGYHCRWIYDLIDGNVNQSNNQNKIYYSDDEFIVISPSDWVENKTDVKGIHLLAFPKDRNIRSLRDLTADHIPLLNRINDKVKTIIKDEYGINSDMIMVYLHYHPDVWLLHIHFVPLNDIIYNHSFEYSHSLDGIINNLILMPDYYKIVVMEVPIIPHKK